MASRISKKTNKKVKRTPVKTKSSVNKVITRFEKEVKKEISEVEKWMIQRKKFLIKLAWILGFVTVLLVFSHFFLRTSGVGLG